VKGKRENLIEVTLMFIEIDKCMEVKEVDSADKDRNRKGRKEANMKPKQEDLKEKEGAANKKEA